MKKICIFSVLLFSALTGFSLDITPPSGAAINLPAARLEPVAITNVVVSDLTVLLSGTGNRTENVYRVRCTFETARTNVQSVVTVKQTDADAMMAAEGYSLQDILAAARGAIGIMLNQKYGSVTNN
ncbi:MAG TPA: hypothetical protein PKI68_01000 [Pontiellaceae bacterium]|nr:hypothetical protein [Pontiellaceae bacterium]